jgi:DNA-directed RNA polymerase subunit RPC12/RpoP
MKSSDGYRCKCNFICGSCARPSSVTAIQRNAGACRCKSQLWTLEIEVIDDDITGQARLINAASFAGTLALGAQIPTVDDGRSGALVEGIGAEIALTLASQSPEELSEALLYLLEELERQERQAARQKLAALGAKPCRQCGSMTVPVPEKPWTYDACCTKACCVQTHQVGTYAEIAEKILRLVPAKLRTAQSAPPEKTHKGKARIPVRCGACKHAFESQRMFAGSRRPCPECGAKILIPS